MKTYTGTIESLEENQVFVFGSNRQGFHGAGAAGFASFGIPGNSWRKFNYDKWPDGMKGMWNVKGVAEGYQEGEKGRSYAIPTVEKPGKRLSINRNGVIEGIVRMYQFARENPDLEFLVAYDNSPNLNGYSPAEMAELFAVEPIPENIVFEERFCDIVRYYAG